MIEYAHAISTVAMTKTWFGVAMDTRFSGLIFSPILPEYLES